MAKAGNWRDWAGAELGAYLAKQMLHLETAVVDLEGGRAGEAVDAVCEGREEIHEDL